MRLCGDGRLLTPVAQVSYFDKDWSFDHNVPDSEQKACSKNDLRLSWNNEKKGITLEGYVGNATNQAALVHSAVSCTTCYCFFGVALSIGLRGCKGCLRSTCHRPPQTPCRLRDRSRKAKAVRA